MRNVSDVSNQRVVDHHIDGTLWKRKYYWYKTKKTFRSDSMSTSKVGGHYVNPTPYEATFAFCTPQDGGQVEWKQRASPGWPWVYHTVSQTGCLHDACTGGLLYGCDPTYGVATVPSSVQSRANERALGMLRKGAWDAGQFLVELKETIGFLAAPLKNIQHLTKVHEGRIEYARQRIRDQLKGRPVRPDESEYLTDALADLWLSYSYGVKPLLSDVYSILEMLEKGLNSPKPRFQIVVEELDESYALPSFNDGYEPRNVSGSAKRGINVVYNATIAEPAKYELWRHGLTNPLIWYWDTVRLSFVVDWFLHIRSYLGSLQAPMGVSFANGYQTTWVKNDYTAYYTLKREGGYPDSLNFQLLRNKQVAARHHLRAMRRQLLFSFPPAPTPYVDLGLNSSQVTSLIALIVQSLKRFSR